MTAGVASRAALLALSCLLSVTTTLAFRPNSRPHHSPSSVRLHRAAALLVETSAKHVAASRVALDATPTETSSSSNSLPRNTTTPAALDGTVEELSVTLRATVPDSSKDDTTVLKAKATALSTPSGSQDDDVNEAALLEQMEAQAAAIVDDMMDETCEVNVETGEAVDEICVDEEKRTGFRATVKGYVKGIGRLVVRGGNGSDDDDTTTVTLSDNKKLMDGDSLEKGWEQRANSSALARNAEVWKFALQCVFRALKPRKMKKAGTASEDEIKAAQLEAAEFIRDGLLELGPSFVKLGQVLSTRTDVLPAAYTDTLKSLTDDVPGFDPQRAKDIVSRELGRPCDEIFQNFSAQPLKAASLGQVHTAMYKGQKVAIKVQRAGLKELFDIDLKNLKKLAVLLDKFDPKSDGADRDWVSIYDESERLLYLEIDYLNEVKNAERFAKDFRDIDWVKVPTVYNEVTTPRVLTMEFVESFKLTDSARVEEEGLDRKLLSKRVADSFLRQIVETAYFHADPHSGNLCVNKDGRLVFYDFGQMDELKPNVRKGFRTFCTALFAGGPMISDTELARNAKDLVKGVEQAGVLSKGADRLAVEKLARFFMRSFKDSQLGKKGGNIKETLGSDLQTLTENNSFRFPSTFTFVFRAFVSVEGIGKELDDTFDIGKLAQPFIEKFIDEQKGYGSKFEKNVDKFFKATGLDSKDIDTAITQPKKVAYIEETLRSMESGSLKIRVRSLENEKSLERMALRQGLMEKLLVSAILLNAAGLAKQSVLRNCGVGGACFFLLQSFLANSKIKKFDKTQMKYVNSEFQDAGDLPEDL